MPPPGYTEVLQENHYYPFGMNMDGPWRVPQGSDGENFYQYNGKDKDNDLGLDWYHYGARIYLPEIGRFTGVDPIAEQFAFVSAYNYAENEPVRHIDLHGLQKFDLMGHHDVVAQQSFNSGGPEQVKEDRGAFQEGATRGLMLGGALVGGGVLIAEAGLAATGTFLVNEAKDEVLSQATGGASDVLDLSKMGTKVLKEGISKLGTKGGERVNKVIDETNAGKGNITSESVLTESEALDAGIEFVGGNAKELGKTGSGVFRSQARNADGTVNQFRIDNGSIQGNHAPNVPHVHLEVIKPNNKPRVNNHIPIKKD